MLNDFASAKELVLAELNVKLQAWQQLPWVFAGLCHYDPVQVQLAASTIVQLLEACSDPTMHHKCVQRSLQSPVLFQQLVALRDGTHVMSEVRELRLFTLPWKF